jgi:hypothetical protein
LADQHVELIEKTTASQAATLVAMTTISIGDTLSDAVVSVASLFTLPYVVAFPQACLFGFALLAQATVSFIVGQGWPATMLSLVGLKPILEAHHETNHAPRPLTQTMPHSVVASITRACEVAFESVPLGLYQLCVALSIDELAVAQIVSLFFSVLATAFIGAQTNRQLDTNANFRTTETVFYGFYPRGGYASLVELGDTLLCGGFSASKFIALAVLMLAAPGIAGGFLAAECCLLLLWRVAEGEWRCAIPSMDGAFVSAMIHMITYLAGQGLVLHVGRLPGYTLGPQRCIHAVFRILWTCSA